MHSCLINGALISWQSEAIIILVKTGKYRLDLAASSGVVPDLVLESLAGLAEHI